MVKEIVGDYATAKVHITDNPDTAIEQYAEAQIKMICDNIISKDQNINIMPDVHPGNVGPIGLVMTIGGKICPALIGPDIGCCVFVRELKERRIDLGELDSYIKNNIPAGSNLHKRPYKPEITERFRSSLCANKYVSLDKIARSFMTLGGGNHFIELLQDDNGKYYIAVHTGSRSFGKSVYDYYMAAGARLLKEKGKSVPYEMTYLEGELKEKYLEDVKVVQGFAHGNANAIVDRIYKGMKWRDYGIDIFCPHNFIDDEENILHKGSISATIGDMVAIPINMKDGIIIGYGRSNPDWMNSAPHGAGRIMSRNKVASNYTLSQFKKDMKGIYSSTISKATLDEAPFAYRKLDEIEEAIKDTVEIQKVLHPVYNFKGEK